MRDDPTVQAALHETSNTRDFHQAVVMLLDDIAESLRHLRPPQPPGPVHVPKDPPDRSDLQFGTGFRNDGREPVIR